MVQTLPVSASTPPTASSHGAVTIAGAAHLHRAAIRPSARRPAAPSHALPARGGRHGRRRHGAQPWLFIGLRPRTRGAAAKESKAPTQSESGPELKPTDPLDEIDELVLTGSYARAMQICETLVDESDDDRRELIRYRLGLCQEGLGDTAAALETFSSLATSPLNGLQLAASFGKARCWIVQGKTDEALQALARLDLLAAHPALRDQPVHGEIQYALGALWLGRVQVADRPSLMFGGLCSAEFRAPVERYLTWGRAFASRESEAPEMDLRPFSVQLDQSNGLWSRTTTRNADLPAMRLLRELAATFHLQLKLRRPPKRP